MESERPSYQVYQIGKGAHHEPLVDDGFLPEAHQTPELPKKHHLFPHAFNAGEIIRECSDTIVESWEDFKARRFKEGGEHDR